MLSLDRGLGVCDTTAMLRSLRANVLVFSDFEELERIEKMVSRKARVHSITKVFGFYDIEYQKAVDAFKFFAEKQLKERGTIRVRTLSKNIVDLNDLDKYFKNLKNSRNSRAKNIKSENGYITLSFIELRDERHNTLVRMKVFLVDMEVF